VQVEWPDFSAFFDGLIANTHVLHVKDFCLKMHVRDAGQEYLREAAPSRYGQCYDAIAFPRYTWPFNLLAREGNLNSTQHHIYSELHGRCCPHKSTKNVACNMFGEDTMKEVT
jgi:hypothetical protein